MKEGAKAVAEDVGEAVSTAASYVGKHVEGAVHGARKTVGRLFSADAQATRQQLSALMGLIAGEGLESAGEAIKPDPTVPPRAKRLAYRW